MVLVWQSPHHEQVEVVERRGAQRHADVTRAQRARTRRLGNVALLQLVEAAGGVDHPGTHGEGAPLPPPYGMNAGDTICSAPLVGIATGAPALAPIGWMYTRNTFF